MPGDDARPSPEFLDFQAALAGEYSLERELGRGGMGIVYLARDVQLDRDVAIKLLPPQLARSPGARTRFLREARMAAGLSHPHIVPIHRVGEAGPFVFFVMSYVEGETLGQRIRAGGPLPPADAARILREVAWALAYAHRRGIVHRDVKPDNILLEAGTGRALVTDFGIAYGAEAPDAATDPGRIMGTAHFMSPEQAAGDVVDGRGDLYALGVVGYLALSGRLPFGSSDLHALILRQATEDPPGVAQAAPGVPPALSAAIDRCLRRDPDERFDDGEALAEALAPPPETRPALPPTLRAWLGARNPLLVPFLAWSGLFSFLAVMNLLSWLQDGHPGGPRDIALLATLAAAPLLPVAGFHLNQAFRQFRAGHSLGDLRAALEVARREREEETALTRDAREPRTHRLLRLATVGAASWLATTFGLLAAGVVHERQLSILFLLVPMGATLALGAVSNALDVQFIPDRIRRWWQAGIRDRLWMGRIGEWFARRLGAPERSQLAGPAAFRATEAALGVAAGELFAALPESYRNDLAGLPAIVASLEARAAEARAEIEVLNAMGPPEEEPTRSRRAGAQRQLAESVAALEGIRLDLLRLHAGAVDLAPLTTLLDAARRIGEDLGRLADAQSEVESAVHRPDRGIP
jgi:serine/threonine-protein kinase